MKHQVFYIVAFLLTTDTLSSQTAPYSITFFIQPLPAHLTQTQQQKQQSMSIAITHEFDPHGLHKGVYVTYLGYMTYSNSFGQVIVPRKTAQDTLQVLVTQDLKPVPISVDRPNTLLGFIVDPKAHASYYTYYLQQNPETELLTWYVTEEPVPEGLIPAQTLIIFEDPEHIIIPVGTTSTYSRDNLVLPTVYITPTAQPALQALRFLKLRKFFSAVTFAYARIPSGYQQQLT
jgi:hypothetical protein